MALFGAACAGSGEPDNYDDAVRENFIEACTGSGEQSGFTLDALQSACTCAYDEFEANVPYVEFKDFDDDLRGDLDTQFPAEYETIFADCIRAAA